MRLTERDIEALKALFMFGCLTASQIAVLFGLNIKVCQRRIRKLLRGGYLRFVRLPSTKGKSPYLLYPGENAEAILGLSCCRPRLTLQLSHQMKNTDVLIGIINSLKSTGIQCDVLPEHIIRTAGQGVIPDGAFILKKADKSALFLFENCAGTEIIRSPSHNQDVQAKIIRYVEMFEANNVGYYEDHFGCSFRRFRLLYVANDARRLSAISDLIREHDVHGFIYISTLGELDKKGLLGDIWGVPAANKTGQALV